MRAMSTLPGRVLPALLVGWILLASAQAEAARLYRWKDGYGNSQRADQPPPGHQLPGTGLEVTRFRNPAGALVKLRLEASGAGYRAYADNSMHGPVQVALRFRQQHNVSARPTLPTTILVPARSSVLVATLVIGAPLEGGSFELMLDALPGDPGSRPRDHDYRLPFENAQVRVDQGPGGSYSHSDPQNLHAIDFALPEGTPIVAVREGVVMQVEADFEQAGLSLEEYGGRANFIRIVHDDGSMALYAHLQPEGVQVRVGQRVRAGQRIGLSGNTGFSTAPHLHFVLQANRGMRLESIPLRMFGPMGELKFPTLVSEAASSRASQINAAP
jgi:murein DD-endopeptidase MepM/ murein hydrolase activator NlpD